MKYWKEILRTFISNSWFWGLQNMLLFLQWIVVLNVVLPVLYTNSDKWVCFLSLMPSARGSSFEQAWQVGLPLLSVPLAANTRLQILLPAPSPYYNLPVFFWKPWSGARQLNVCFSYLSKLNFVQLLQISFENMTQWHKYNVQSSVVHNSQKGKQPNSSLPRDERINKIPSIPPMDLIQPRKRGSLGALVANAT